MKKFENFLNEEKTHNLTRYMNDDEIYENLLVKSMNYLLVESAKVNCFKGVKKALDEGANVDTSNSEPLAWAVSKQNNEIMNYLIDNGAEINDKVFSQIYRKVKTDKIKLITNYLEHKHFDNVFINFIAYYSDIETFKYIIEKYLKDGWKKSELLNGIRANVLLNNIEIMDYVLKNGYKIGGWSSLYTMDWGYQNPLGFFSNKNMLGSDGKIVWNFDIKEIEKKLEDEKKKLGL